MFLPKQMEIANVVAKHKGDPTSDCSNYGPVLIFPVLSKALEKIVHSRINNLLIKHSVLSDCQFGFRKHKSTELALT